MMFHRVCSGMLLGVMVASSGCASLSSLATKGPPPPTTGTDVIQRMYARYEGRWFQTMQFTLENTRTLSNARTERSQWKQYILAPGRARIEFLPAAGGNGAVYADGNVYSFEGGKRSRTAPQVNMLLLLMADVYAQPSATTLRQLGAVGVDVTKFRRETWNGRSMYVIGSTGPTDLGSPQLWVDGETWMVHRFVERAAQGGTLGPRPATEYRLSDYRTLSGIPVVHEVTMLRDGQQIFRQQFTDVQLNTAIDARLFSASQWRVPGVPQ
jgi:outer membrane lipoprotein-sorting protein